MLAVVDAFDSMTSDQAYRQAMSRERALNELFVHAGTQFDPDLVKSFSELQITVPLHSKVISHWLRTLHPQQSNRFWRSLGGGQHGNARSDRRSRVSAEAARQHARRRDLCRQRNADHPMEPRGGAADGILGLERAVAHLVAEPDRHVRRRRRRFRDAVDCPITYCITTGVQSLRRLLVTNRDDRPIAVDVHTVPVIGPDGTMYGAAMLLHDASPEATLEEQCQNLHEKATKDPLTQVANRAEFDRAYALFIEAHVDRRLPCSLIICDIDHFKSINDTFGHQAGDEVLKNLRAAAQERMPPGRPGGPLRRRGVRLAVRRLHECRGGPPRRAIAQDRQRAAAAGPATASA